MGALGVFFIVLILKKKGALPIKDYRPISLIGSLYKILAKVLTNRLAKLLHMVISNNQSTFISGHQILDSVLIAYECVESQNRYKIPGVICKLDFEKACDMVDWSFLMCMLEHMGFGRKWWS